MQWDEDSTTDTSRAPGPDHEGSSSNVQLSTNMTRRLEKLARWRIDPGLIKFSKDAPEFTGGYATVCRALLTSTICETKDQLAESNVGNPALGCRGPNAGGFKDHQEVKGGNYKEKQKEDPPNEEGEEEPGSEISGPWKAVAIKKMKLRPSDEVVRILALTLREAEFLFKLSHEHIIKLEGFVEDLSKNMIWLVFQWEDNGTLKDFVALHDWEIPERLSLIYDVTRGVEYLQSRQPPIVHGDLKSINILVNEKCRAVITDFGSARYSVMKSPNEGRAQAGDEPKQIRSPEATFCPSTNTITLTCNQYTLRWAAPELLEEDDASLASDIWAVGWVAYEVMTNSIPFQDVKDAIVIKRVVQGELPSISSDARMLLIQALCSLVGQCWSIDPSKRPTAEACRKEIAWMPMITPNPAREADATGFVDRSPELLMKLGKMHRRQSDYANASKYYAKALDVYIDIADSNGQAFALMELAQMRRFQCDYSQAAKYYSEALKIHTDIGDRQGRASALCCLAEVHRLRNEHSQAVALYSECLQIWNDLDESRGRASALCGLARVHRARNEYVEAIALYYECLQIRTDIGDKDGRTEALWDLAEVHRARNEYSQAAALYSECLQIRTDVGDRRGRADALWGLAEVHRARGEHNQAVALYSECLQTQTDIGERQGRASALWGLAGVHRARNEHTQAIAFYSECLQTLTDIGNKQGMADALWALAEVHRLQNQHNQAVALYSDCLKIQTEIGNRRGRADALWALAEMHRAQKDYHQAVTFYIECLQIQTDIGGRRGRASALWGLAGVHWARSEYPQAIALYSECLQIREDIGDIQGKSDALWGLASVYRARKEYTQAATFYSECLQIRIDLGDKQGRADALWGLAQVHGDRQEYSQAIALYHECLEYWTEIGNTRGRSDALWGIAHVHRAQYEYIQALVHYFDALKLRFT